MRWYDQSDSLIANDSVEKVSHKASVSLLTVSLCYVCCIIQEIDMLNKVISTILSAVTMA